MNRPAVGPQSLRGMPNGFQAQQQIVQNRSVSSRLPPSGKMAGNGTTWGFGGGLPMGSAGLGNTRPSNAPMTSFAQTIGGSSQPATSLDLSEFPSLSNNQPQPSQSAWAAAGARTLGPSTNMRLQQQAGLSSQQQLNNQQQTQQQQEDLFSSSSQLPSSQGGFRFGSQNAVGQSVQSNPVDDFPPLNRNANGEIGQDRSSSIIPNVGFGAQSNGMGFGQANPSQTSRSNGLLNALSGSNRVTPGNRVASPGSISGLSVSRSPTEGTRHVSGESDTNTFSNAQFAPGLQQPQRDEPTALSIMSRTDVLPQQEVTRSQTLDSNMGSAQSNAGESNLEVQDPLPGMSEMDRWGLKGFSVMMNNFPDYAALVTGTDMANFGFDLNSNENISSQIYSLWENEPPRPAVPRFTLPDCYTVSNVAALETKMSNFNDEALIFMFYSNPGDVQQLMAAQELHQRNWRYHKKLQLWLTKDEMMVPQSMGNGTERGYYIFFDIKQWHRERREFTLIYDDLENPSVHNALTRALV
ncbi:hypothetical protein VTL71DRAFT_7116 [Oculimacula yallundae]|uniref:NOT2/NOT3/NOT5 C-terminal domain-containing protein n=1 Tax=Oculimacula yallundae TaxID=86028 RepID=A0ABR4BVS5_9HELO